MILAEGLLIFFSSAATLSLAVGYGIEGLTGLTAAFALTGILWWAAGRKFGGFFIPLGFFTFIGGAAGGVLAGFNFYLMLGGLVAALGTWDLLRFRHRLSRVEGSCETEILVSRHTLKLTIVLILGASLSLAAVSLELQLGFWMILGIAVVLLISLQGALKLFYKHR
jgi:hypothetical protein